MTWRLKRETGQVREEEVNFDTRYAQARYVACRFFLPQGNVGVDR